MAPHLPTPIVSHICRTLSDSGGGVPTLASLRLADRRHARISSPLAFRSLRITHGADVRSIVAALDRDAGLAACVQRIDIDLDGAAEIIPTLGLVALAKLIRLATNLEAFNARIVGWEEGMAEPSLVLNALAAVVRPSLRAIEFVVRMADGERDLATVPTEVLRRTLVAAPGLELLHLRGVAVRGAVVSVTELPLCRLRSVFVLDSVLGELASAIVASIIGRAERISVLGSDWTTQRTILWHVNRWSKPLEIEVGGCDALPIRDQHCALDWIEITFQCMPLVALRTARTDHTRPPALLLYDPARIVALHLHGADPAFSAVELGHHLRAYAEVLQLRAIVASRIGDTLPLQLTCEVLGIHLDLRDVGCVSRLQGPR